MKNIIKSACVSVLFLASMSSYANPAQNLSQLLSNVKSMSANFSQTTTGTRKTTFSGTMSAQNPNKFRWHTTKPSEQLIVANGSYVWIYDKDLAQATKQSASDQIGDTPALLLSGNPAQINQNFNITQPNPAKNYFVLKPKTQSAFSSLSISFNGGKPVMMVISDSLGQTTSVKFSNIKLNQSIAANQFSFTPPAGTDIIAQ